MSGGGSGNSQTVLGTWSPFMENMWGGSGGNPGLLNRATDTLNTPYTQYQGQRVAGINSDQNNAMGGIRYLAQNGSDIADAGSRATQTTLNGQYLGSNQWTDPSSIGYNTEQVNPAFNAQTVSAGTNEYAGDNPYIRGVVQQGMTDITDNYNRGTAADTRRAANMAGAFGGSAHQAQIANNESGLARNLSNYSNQMANQQYDRSAGLREADIGRQLGAQQFNVGTAGQNVDRFNQADQFNVGLANQNVDRYNQNRQLGAG
ncbi:MAG: hypothetical protein WC657_08875, partial [Candidatus Paceibacterota bacterium]